MKLIDEGKNQDLSELQACEAVGIDPKTVRNWRKNGWTDRRHEGNGGRNNPLGYSEKEQQIIVERFCRKDVCDVSLHQAFYKVLDTEGQYYCSVSTLYRIFKAKGLNVHRAQCRAPRKQTKPTTYEAACPNQVWSWDITYFRHKNYNGRFFYAYVLMDIYSRRVMHAKVYEADNADYAGRFLKEAFCSYGIKPEQLVLHSDNGSSMKAASTLALLEKYGIIPSHSRPRVSNDNPYSESLFRTLKYNGFFLYPHGGFEEIDKAQSWLDRFVKFYNCEHMHRGIKMVTPDDRYNGRDELILRRRNQIIREAKKKNPHRWINNKVMDLKTVGPVYLNPEKPLCLAA